jgi:hypothetical protein
MHDRSLAANNQDISTHSLPRLSVTLNRAISVFSSPHR